MKNIYEEHYLIKYEEHYLIKYEEHYLIKYEEHYTTTNIQNSFLFLIDFFRYDYSHHIYCHSKNGADRFIDTTINKTLNVIFQESLDKVVCLICRNFKVPT